MRRGYRRKSSNHLFAGSEAPSLCCISHVEQLLGIHPSGLQSPLSYNAPGFLAMHRLCTRLID